MKKSLANGPLNIKNNKNVKNKSLCKGTPWQTFQIFDSIGGFPAISGSFPSNYFFVPEQLAQIGPNSSELLAP